MQDEIILTPTPRQWTLLGMGVLQLSLMIGAVVVALGLLATSNYLPALVLIAVAAILIIPYGGFPGFQWVPHIWRNLRLLMRGGYTFEKRANLLGFEAHTDRVPDVLVPHIGQPRMLTFRYGDGAVAALQSNLDGTFTICVTASAGRFHTSDPDEQQSLNSNFGALLDQLALSEQPLRRVQWTHRSIPATTLGHEGYLRQEGRLNVGADELSRYAQTVNLGYNKASWPTIEMTFTFARKILRRQGGLRDYSGDFYGAMSDLERHVPLLMQIGLQNPHPMGPYEYTNQLRRAFDPVSHLEIDLDDQEIEAGTMQERQPLYLSPWPDYVYERPTYVQTDNSFHRTYWISGYSSRPVQPDFMARFLHTAGVMRTVTIVAAPVPPEIADRQRSFMATANAAFDEFRQEQGQRDKVASRNRRAMFARQEQEAAAGHSTWRYSGYVTVSAGSLDDLERACKTVRQDARRQRFNLRPPLKRQLEALTFTAPMGRGIR